MMFRNFADEKLTKIYYLLGKLIQIRIFESVFFFNMNVLILN